MDYEHIVRGFLNGFTSYVLDEITFRGQKLSKSPLGIQNPYDLMELLLIIMAHTKAISVINEKNMAIQKKFDILMKHAEFMINHDLQRDKTAIGASFADLANK